MTKTFDKIYKVLPEYYTTSEEMIMKGFPWAVVLSFHEVYRHLYPTDAYIKNYSVSDQEKPQYLLNLLENQLTLYSAIENSVLPYDNILSNVSSNEENNSKEKHTHMLYGDLWEKLTLEDVTVEPGNLLKKRINSPGFSFLSLKDKNVLDLGCGSGRYTIALSAFGCKRITGYDMGEQGINVGRNIIKKLGIQNVIFEKGNVLDLPYENESFDFVFCNGVLHHTKDMEKGISELYRVLKTSGKAFIYLYADKGLFWNFRKKARQIMCKIPKDYAQRVLDLIGLPSNRFVFMDTWYVPIERHTSKEELEDILLNSIGFKSIEKVISEVGTDLDVHIADGFPHAEELYGDGEHRYLLTK
jgi:ubiquinone/menaquinone biosynthesis C-methylase UbiE